MQHAKPMPQPAEWRISDALVPYPDALRHMEDRVAAIRAGAAAEEVWLLEHPPLYTAGTSANPADLVTPDRFPVYQTGRGGQYTYHGPGQRVGYLMLDLRQRGRDVRSFVFQMEEMLIQTLAHFGVGAERRADRVGVWVTRSGGREEKIGAIGVRVRGWISYHGFALNIDPELEHFSGIIPCGIADHGVTSLADLGLPTRMDDVDTALATAFEDCFGLSPRPLSVTNRAGDASRGSPHTLTAEHNQGDPVLARHPSFAE